MSGYGEAGEKEQPNVPDERERKSSGQLFSKPAVFVSLIGLVFFVVAASSVIVTVKEDKQFYTRSGRTRRQLNTTKNNACDFSEEAIRVGGYC